MCEFDKLDKTFASDLYLIYKRSPSARVCISDKDQLLMFYLSLIKKHILDFFWERQLPLVMSAGPADVNKNSKD